MERTETLLVNGGNSHFASISVVETRDEFDLRIGDQHLKNLRAEVRQRNGTDFQIQPLEVGNVVGYDGPWNYEKFREFCRRYYRDVIGSSGLSRAINRGDSLGWGLGTDALEEAGDNRSRRQQAHERRVWLSCYIC